MRTNSPPALGKEILTCKEAQRLLGISKPTFFRWRSLGLIKTAKVRGRIFVRRQDLLDLVDRHMGDDGSGSTSPHPSDEPAPAINADSHAGSQTNGVGP